jgi:hypothetical protein
MYTSKMLCVRALFCTIFINVVFIIFLLCYLCYLCFSNAYQTFFRLLYFSIFTLEIVLISSEYITRDILQGYAIFTSFQNLLKTFNIDNSKEHKCK